MVRTHPGWAGMARAMAALWLVVGSALTLSLVSLALLVRRLVAQGLGAPAGWGEVALLTGASLTRVLVWGVVVGLVLRHVRALRALREAPAHAQVVRALVTYRDSLRSLAVAGVFSWYAVPLWRGLL